MYEHHSEKLLPVRKFVYRLFWHGLVALATIACALGIGIIGYHCLEGLSWLDSFLAHFIFICLLESESNHFLFFRS